VPISTTGDVRGKRRVWLTHHVRTTLREEVTEPGGAASLPWEGGEDGFGGDVGHLFAEMDDLALRVSWSPVEGICGTEESDHRYAEGVGEVDGSAVDGDDDGGPLDEGGGAEEGEGAGGVRDW
jgi:hypothetical protein